MERNVERSKFGRIVEPLENKIQVGARGSKNGPDWKAIDKYDKSILIDENVDLHDLPYDDCTVDCYVCNAVLEHVFEPQLAIFEMYRTLKIGGYIWVEVPFNQFYHAHPYDFRRWTTLGLEWEMRRFEKHGSGITATLTREIQNVAKVLQRENDTLNISPSMISKMEGFLNDYSDNAKLLRLYSGTFFWGRKNSHEIDSAEALYMKRLQNEVLNFDIEQ